MRRSALLFTLLPLMSCKPVACYLGFTTNADGACVIDQPAPCAEGQIRAVDGSCANPSGYEVTDGESLDAPAYGAPPDGPDPETTPSEDTAQPTDTGDTVDTVDTNETVPVDTGTIPTDGACDYTIDLYTGSYPGELGLGITDTTNDRSLLLLAPGDIVGAGAYRSYPLTVASGRYVFFELFDSAGDGWDGASFDVYRNRTGNYVLRGQSIEGRTGSFEQYLGCNE